MTNIGDDQAENGEQAGHREHGLTGIRHLDELGCAASVSGEHRDVRSDRATCGGCNGVRVAAGCEQTPTASTLSALPASRSSPGR